VYDATKTGDFCKVSDIRVLLFCGSGSNGHGRVSVRCARKDRFRRTAEQPTRHTLGNGIY